VSRSPADRLTTLDASFLCLDQSRTPLDVHGVVVPEAPPSDAGPIAAAVQAGCPW
jgi:hypothetical protein